MVAEIPELGAGLHAHSEEDASPATRQAVYYAVAIQVRLAGQRKHLNSEHSHECSARRGSPVTHLVRCPEPPELPPVPAIKCENSAQAGLLPGEVDVAHKVWDVVTVRPGPKPEHNVQRGVIVHLTDLVPALPPYYLFLVYTATYLVYYYKK